MKSYQYIYIILFLLLGFSLTLKGQDIHFSQFYNMPLQLNPSLSGHIEGTYRVKLIYRNQWSSITSGGVYSTPGLSFDMNFKLKEESRNSLGAGLLFINDQTGGGDFNNLVILASAAYHMNLDKKEKTYLSFGVQGGMISKRLDTNALIFSDQFDNSGNVGMPTMENFANTNISGGDLRLGVTFSSYPSNKMNYKLGVAYMHLLQSKEIFLTNTATNTLPGRVAVFAEGEFKTKNPKLSILPEILFMTQASINQINLTTNLGYQISPDFELIFGGGYRLSDAAIVGLGFGFKGVELMATYDINISKLNPASQYQGGFEISLGYIGRIKKEVDPTLPCIRF